MLSPQQRTTSALHMRMWTSMKVCPTASVRTASQLSALPETSQAQPWRPAGKEPLHPADCSCQLPTCPKNPHVITDDL